MTAQDFMSKRKHSREGTSDRVRKQAEWSSPQADSGFTIIELLLVVAIIAMMATASMVYFMQALRSTGLQESGTMMRSAMGFARRYATNKRRAVFMGFVNKKNQSYMYVIADGPPPNENQQLDFNFGTATTSNGDELIKTYTFPRLVSIRMNDSANSPPLFQSSATPWIRIGPGGSITGSSENPADDQYALKNDNTWRDSGNAPAGPGDCDMMFEKKTGELLYLDWEPAIGKVTKTYYK